MRTTHGRFGNGTAHARRSLALLIVMVLTVINVSVVLTGCASAPQRAGQSPDRDGPEASPPADLARVPDAEPRLESIRNGGPNKPYGVLGKSYVPITQDAPFTERGLASWYGRKFHGKRTASGEVYNMYAMTAAHPTLPIPSYARIRNPANGREVLVRINDRGPFHPDRIVSRIMGMGDIATLLERAEEKLDRGKAEQFAKKALSGDGFSLEDFRDQLRQIKKMGSMKSIMKMLPSVGPFAGMAQAAENVDEGQLTRTESIINSMTAKERADHEIINGNRRKRIATGSGTSVQEVNNLLRQYAQMRKMFKTMGGGGGIKAQQRMMSQMQGRQKFGR